MISINGQQTKRLFFPKDYIDVYDFEGRLSVTSKRVGVQFQVATGIRLKQKDSVINIRDDITLAGMHVKFHKKGRADDGTDNNRVTENKHNHSIGSCEPLLDPMGNQGLCIALFERRVAIQGSNSMSKWLFYRQECYMKKIGDMDEKNIEYFVKHFITHYICSIILE